MILKTHIIICLNIIVFISCNPRPKDSVQKADSTNKAILDSGLKHNSVVVDEHSTDFLVRISDIVSVEKEISSTAMHLGVIPVIKDFAATLYHELVTINDSIQSLHIQKNIVLPTTVSAEGQTAIDLIRKARGGDLDKTFLNYVISTHENSKTMFTDAMSNVKDEDIRGFADITSIIFKKYLNTARSLKY